MPFEVTSNESSGRPRGAARRATRGVLLAAYAVLALTIYWPSFSGGPISDDYLLILNPWVSNPTREHLLEILDPRSQVTLLLRNYAPVRALVQALEWKLFPRNTQLFHAANAVAHAFACWLLALLLRQAGLSGVAAGLGAAFVLVHPALVEAVAWMSQIWNPLGLALGTGALLAQRRRPALACALFVLALLTRPTAVSFLPVALLREWSWRRDAAAPRRALWLAAWTLALLAVGAAELSTFHESGAAARLVPYPDAAAKARTLVADFGRYLAMAATGFGVSAFQEPRVARSWLDPWWLFGLAAGALIAGRGLRCLLRGREEAAWWTWAVAAFVPVSQLFPFLYPTADRYLYFMLPGLVGGVLLAGRELSGRWLAEAHRSHAARLAAAAALAAIVALALTSHSRAALWTAEDNVHRDAARHYPHGVLANLQAARRAGNQGDVDAAVDALEACRARGWDFYSVLLTDKAFEPVRHAPAFQALIDRFADDLIEVETHRARKTQLDWLNLGQAYELRKRRDQAAAAFEQGLALGGPLDEMLRGELAKLRAPTPPDPAAILGPAAPPEGP